jgi:hypothetical protein
MPGDRLGSGELWLRHHLNRCPHFGRCCQCGGLVFAQCLSSRIKIIELQQQEIDIWIQPTSAIAA